MYTLAPMKRRTIMRMIQNQHLSEMNHFITMYQALPLPQLRSLFHELPEATVLSLIKKLEKLGLVTYDIQTGIIKLPAMKKANPGIIAAVWVLLDFLSDVTYHTISSFPAVLSFYTEGDGYDVIFIPIDKESLYNHALPEQTEGNKRLVIIQDICQLQKIDFPQISAFCRISDDGQVQYFKKQGGT